MFRKKRKMETYVFRLTRNRTGSELSFKEKMPENYFPFFIKILESGYPDWNIEVAQIVEEKK